MKIPTIKMLPTGDVPHQYGLVDSIPVMYHVKYSVAIYWIHTVYYLFTHIHNIICMPRGTNDASVSF